MSSRFKYLLVYSSPRIDCTRANESKFAKTVYNYVLYAARRVPQENEGYKNLETSPKLLPMLHFSYIFVMLVRCIPLPL